MSKMTPKRGPKNLPLNLERMKIEAKERRRNILHLIVSYLKDNMLEQTAECLANEAPLDDTYRLCENVELDIILQEYQSYYYAKFQKYPKIVKRLEEGESRQVNKRSAKRPSATAKKPESPPESDGDFQFEIIPLNVTKDVEKPKLLPPEVDQYTIEINPVNWGDCVGLENAIEILKEATLYPLQYPDIYEGLIPWKGVLLHGPPGTGKTLLAKALASESHTTFFNVTCSTFISKWRGESEKLIKNLFDMAKQHAPSTIFFDEIDALISGGREIQHEASKRFRSELLVNLDGIASNEGQIFVLASTNSPWDLDGALLRRFDKRILIDMPGKDTRVQILKRFLKNVNFKASDANIEEFTQLTEHYSGSDIKNLAKEVTMNVARERIKSLKRGDKHGPTKTIEFINIKQALEKIRPSTNNSTRKKYYQWQNEHGAQ